MKPNLQQLEQERQEKVLFVSQLMEEYDSNRINDETFLQLMKEKTGFTSIKSMNKDYIKRKRQLKYGKYKPIVLSLIFILFIGLGLFFFDGGLTGQVIGSELQSVENLDLLFNENSSYDLNLNNVNSFRITGEIFGEGVVKVWVNTDTDRYLVFVQEPEELGNLLTGQVTKNETLSILNNKGKKDKKLDEIIIEEPSQTNVEENITEEPIINITEPQINVEENVTEEINNTSNITEEIITIELNNSLENISINNNITDNEIINDTEIVNPISDIDEEIIEENITIELNDTIDVEENITEEIIEEPSQTIRTFNDICIETCYLDGINITSLDVEVNGVSMNLDNIKYTYTEYNFTEENTTEVIIVPVENITEINDTIEQNITDIDTNITIINSTIVTNISTINVSNVSIINQTILVEPLLDNETFSLIVKDKNNNVLSEEKIGKQDISLNKKQVKNDNKKGLSLSSSEKKNDFKIKVKKIDKAPKDIELIIDSYENYFPEGEFNSDVVYTDELYGDVDITLEKTGDINAILKCEDFNKESFTCNNWKVINILYEENDTYVSFTVKSFSAYGAANIDIINIQSYPVLYGNWEVKFTTIGDANLTIEGYNGTVYDQDLEYVSLYCGDNLISMNRVGNLYSVENYVCEEESRFTVRELSTGKHTQKFTYGNSVGYAYNDASNIPKTMNIQGKVTDSSLNNLDGEYTFNFKIYDISTGGSALWWETQTVTVTDGIYNAILGSVNPLNLSFAGQMYLGVEINSDGEMTPRINLTSSAYSERSRTSDSLECVDCINSTHIANSSIETENINNDAITDAKITSVSATKITSGTLGSGAYVFPDGVTIQGSLDMNNQKITGLGTPTISTDAATKAYVDSQITSGGSKWSNNSNDIYYNDGNVGIGTMSPLRALSVEGVFGVQYDDLNERFAINPTSTGVDASYRDASGDMDFRIDTRTGQEIIWYNGAGNFGIGTETPGEKLEVAGNINVTTGNDICIEGGNCLSDLMTSTTDNWVDTTGDTMTGDLNMNNNAITNIDWSTSDDGSGSGLDADTLDGTQGASFVKYGATIMNTNNFGGDRLYINSINNPWYLFSERYDISGIYGGTYANIFDGNYESYYVISAGNTDTFTMNWSGAYPGYPYGDIYVSFYYTFIPESVTGRVYTNYAPHGVGWHNITFTKFKDAASATIYKADNSIYAIEALEMNIEAQSGSDCRPTEIEINLERPGTQEMPIVDKYKENTLYKNLNFINSIVKIDGNNVWHEGNDGSGSSLDADTLDGSELSELQEDLDATSCTYGIASVADDGTITCASQQGSGDGDVTGPASATNNAIARFDGTTGKLIQNSSVYIDDSGNLGIGITTPGEKLEVAGNINVTTGNDICIEGGNCLSDLMSSTTDNWVDTTGDSMTGALTMSGTAANIVLGSNYLSGDGGDEGVFVDSSGNVGIGTDSPGALLNLNGATSTGPKLNITEDNKEIAILGDVGSSNDIGVLGLYSDGIRNVFLSSDSSAGDSYFNGGNVGIGTTSPSGTLDVNGTDMYFRDSTNSRYIRLNPGSTEIDAYTDQALKLNENSVGDVLLVNGGGNVGIGTITPNYKLDVSGTSNFEDTMTFDGDSTSEGQITFGANNFRIQSLNGGTLELLEDGGNGINIIDGGNIGIGDTSPDGTLKLDVEGQVGATEYCDENGANCIDITNVGIGSMSSFNLSGDSGTQTITEGNTLSILGITPISTIAEATDKITISLDTDSITDTQLAYNTGQHLTTTSSPTFAGGTFASTNDGRLILKSTDAGTQTGVKEAGWNYIQFYDAQNDRQAYFGIDSSGNFVFNPEISGADIRVNRNFNLNNNALLNIDWSISDDGSGSGLDADTLDGSELSALQEDLDTTSCTYGIASVADDGTITCASQQGSGDGDVTGPLSSTDNAIVRFNGITGKVIQNSGVVIDDAGNLGINISSPSTNLEVNGEIKTKKINVTQAFYLPVGEDMW